MLIHNTTSTHSQSGEMNEDFYNFQQAISHLQELEEDVVDTHKIVTDVSVTFSAAPVHGTCRTINCFSCLFSLQNHRQWTNTHHQLLQIAAQVDYDVDSYSQRLEALLADQMEHLTKLRFKVGSFRTQLAEEEQISKDIVKRKK